VRERPLALSALLFVATIAAGLAIRLAPLGLPNALAKYGGSLLWALMIYWIVSSVRPLWHHMSAALVSSAIAFCVELFKLFHTPLLDALRLTLSGKLLLGRVFSLGGSRCLIPRFDGAILSLEWKEAVWDKFVMGAPRPRTPSEQQYSDRKLRSRR
jgi:hypothetical protein